jgi:DnaK suppressor protein
MRGEEMMDGMLLQTVQGLGEPLPLIGCDIWEGLQSEKEEVARKLLAEGPLCQSAEGMLESEASEEYSREVAWRYRQHLEARLRDLNEAQDRLMNGTYGHCCNCGAEIDRARLAADAAAALCLGCQRSTEAEVVYCTL